MARMQFPGSLETEFYAIYAFFAVKMPVSLTSECPENRSFLQEATKGTERFPGGLGAGFFAGYAVFAVRIPIGLTT